MKKFILPIIIIIGGTLLLWFGFSKQNQLPKSSSISQEPIKIGVFVYPGFGTFYIAKEKDLFKKHGVNVELVQVSADNWLPAVESNKIQMVTFTSDVMPILADIGVAAKQIFTTSFSYGADGLGVTNEIQKISDLKGKKVHVTLGFPGHFFFRYLANKSGLSYGDVELINLNPEEVGSSFVASKINAGVTYEPWLSKAKERIDGKVLVTSRQEPEIITDIIVARNDLIANRREDIKNVMRAFFEALDWWEGNTTEGNAIVAKNFKLTPEEFKPMRDTVKLSNLKINLEKFDKQKPLNVYELVEKAGEIYFQDGVIKTKASSDAVTDSSLLNELR